MSAMSELFAKTNAFLDKLKTDAEHLVPEFQDILDELLGRVGAAAEDLGTEAKADGEQLAGDIEQDAKGLTETAAADVTTQSAPAAAPSTTPPAAAPQG